MSRANYRPVENSNDTIGDVLHQWSHDELDNLCEQDWRDVFNYCVAVIRCWQIARGCPPNMDEDTFENAVSEQHIVNMPAATNIVKQVIQYYKSNPVDQETLIVNLDW